MRFGKLLAVLVVGVCAYFGAIGVAKAACVAGVGNQIICTGGGGASVSTDGNTTGTIHAGTYPATLAVSGVPGGSTVTSVVLKINGYTTLSGFGAGVCAANGCGASRDVGIVLEGPLTSGSKPNLQVMRAIGRASSPQTNSTVTIQDGATQMPSPGAVPPADIWSGTGTWAPTATDGTLRDGEVSPTYSPTGPASVNSPAPLGAATLTTAFGGKTVIGTWNLYLATDSGNLFGLAASISFTSFDLTINYSGASTPSTTTLTPSPTTAFTSGTNSTVTLTSTVTAGATGSVTFKEGNTVLTCSGGNPATLSGGTATCATTFSAEGVHVLTANYAGDGTFVSSSGTANVFIQNHAGNPSGTTYCNTGAVTATGTSDLVYSSTTPYPSVIVIGDGVNPNIANSVNTLSLKLKNFSAPQLGTLTGVHMLLVAPDNTHAYDFWSNVGNSASLGDYIFQDGSGQVPSGPISPSSYGPTADGPPPDSFTPNAPAPAPQVPGSFVYAPPVGSSTFQTAFSGAAASGAWKLFMYNNIGPGINATAAGGWCLTISPATGQPTTTTVTSSANPNAVLGASVSFTATVAASPTPNIGSVTFTENGSPLTGAPNGGVAAVVSGSATIATSGLPEGDHTITAAYHDSTNTLNDSFGTVTIRIDKMTSTPTLSGSTWSYCNTGVVTIPAGTITLTNIGPAGPNPTNVMVTNMPGTISSSTITLNGFSHFHPSILQSLLVGPNTAGASLPTSAQTFDFFTNAGGINSFGPQNTTFTDSSAAASSVSPPSASSGPASYGAVPTFTASTFFTLPTTFQRATTAGAFTFNTGTYTGSAGGIYKNTLPNGIWSLYFDQTAHQTAGGGMPTGWCMNFIANPVTGTGTTAHVGPAPGNHMRQGGTTGTVTLSLLNNGDSNSQGSTGDPDGSHGMVVQGTLPAGVTLGTVPVGTPWACIANTSTSFTCHSSSAITHGANYPLLTLPVNVAGAAAASVTVSGVTFTGAGMTPGTFASDTIIIDPAPILAITKGHSGTFTQGQNATWTLQVNNNSATAAGATDGSTVTVTDVLPSGYTLVSGTGSGWSCSGTTTVTCTSTAIVAGTGGAFPLITLTVGVPAASAVSVGNSGKVFGGGDLNHSNSGNAAASNTDAVTVIQVPASITINGSATQSTAISTVFGSLAVTVKDAGGVTIPNFTPVVFTAVPGGSGQSGTFDTTTGTKSVTTGTGGSAGVANPGVFTANSTAGAYTVDVAAGSAPHATFNLSNVCSGPLTVNPATLPNGTAGTAYNQSVNASGGSGAVSFNVSAGGVPGVSLASSGRFSGAPYLFGPFSLTVTATDSIGCTGSATYNLNIRQNPAVHRPLTDLHGG